MDRRYRALSWGKHYSHPQLLPSEVALVNSVPGAQWVAAPPFHGCSASMGEQSLESISFGEQHTASLNRDDQLATGRSRVRRLKPLDEPEAVAASSYNRVLNRSSASKVAQGLKRPAAARESTSKQRRTNGVE